MILLSFLSILVFGILDNFRGPYFSQVLNEFSLNETLGAALFGTTSAFASLFSGFGGPLLRKWGPIGLLNFSSLIMGAGFITMGLSPHYAILLVGAAVFGAGLGLASLAQNVAVAEYSPLERRSQRLSGLHATYGLASMLAPWLAHTTMGFDFDWRWAFAMVGSLPVLLAAGGLLAKDDRAKNFKAESQAQSKVVLSFGRRGHIWLFGFVTALYLLAEISFGTRLVRWLEVHHGLPAIEGSLYLTGFFAALFVGRLLSSIWAPSSVVHLRLALSLSAILGLVLGSLALSYWPWFVVPAGLVMGPFYPLSMSYVRNRFQKDNQVAMAVALGVGSFTVLSMHFGIGIVATNYSLHTAMWVGPMGLSLALLGLFLEARIKC